MMTDCSNLGKEKTLKDLLHNYESQKKLLKTVKLHLLPDKGLKIHESIARLKQEIDNYAQSVDDATPEPTTISNSSKDRKQDVVSDATTVLKAVSSVRITEPEPQKNEQDINAIVKNALTSYARCFEECPTERDECVTPSQLSTQLLPHQRQALAWMKWREDQVPSGGILGDDMGFGKTLSMIALILSKRTEEHEGDGDATLIVCPASLIHHWAKEFSCHCQKESVYVEIYHGPKRRINNEKCTGSGKYVVITTYDIVRGEMKPHKEPVDGRSASGLSNCKWKRTVLDEGHIIRNPRSKISTVVCDITADHRWIVTGTPIQNSEADAYALIRFLKCAPFDDPKIWKHIMQNGKGLAPKRLNIILKALILRRVKGQTALDGKPLVPLPEKLVVTHHVELSPSERKLYKTVFSRYKTAMKHYFSAKKSVKSVEVLVCLLRLRQLCCHPCLAKEEVPKEEFELENLFAKLTLDGEKDAEEEKFSVKQDVGDVMGDKLYSSSKLTVFLDKLKALYKVADTRIKCVVVSQWTSMLEVAALHLKKLGLRYHTLTGKTLLKARQDIVEDVNSNPQGPEILLLSLTAGGTGLNLIGASHLFMLDLHWNPALELQAYDRIHRVGQRNNVHIHRFICDDTVEESIDRLQKRKLDLASNALTPNGKLKSMKDEIKEIFGF